MALRNNTASGNRVTGLMVALKPNREVKWARTLDLKGAGNEGYSIAQNNDTLVMAGCAYGKVFTSTLYNMFITKLNISTGVLIPSGTVIYQKQSGISEGGYSAQLFKTTNGFIFNFTATFLAIGTAPQTNSNIVVGVSNRGKVLFSKQFNNPFCVNPSQWMPIAPTSDGGLIAVQNYATTPTHVTSRFHHKQKALLKL